MAAKVVRNLRKRKAEDAEDSADDEPTGEVLRKILDDTKFLQRQRDRRAGLDAAAQLRATEDTGPLEVKAAHKVQDELMGAFSKEQKQDELERDPEMEKYIEAQLAKRLGIKPKGDANGEDGVAVTEEDDLYNIPESLRGQQTKQQDVSSWVTGIQEVQLSLDYKLKNIEETEAAKKQLLASAGAGPGREQLDEEEDEEAQRHPKGVHRAVFPRDFGRQNAKDVDRRVQTVLSSQVEKPSWKERKGKGRRRPGG